MRSRESGWSGIYVVYSRDIALPQGWRSLMGVAAHVHIRTRQRDIVNCGVGRRHSHRRTTK